MYRQRQTHKMFTARNKLRNQVIPQLEEINERAVWLSTEQLRAVLELFELSGYADWGYKKNVLQIEPQSCRKETNLATGAVV